jgi:tRNA(fMet)-specific endonuclease VapC
LTYGALNAQDPARMVAEVERFPAAVRTLAFGGRAARLHGELRRQLRHQPIGPEDLVIAASALRAGATLVTANGREFARVPGLVTENWR